MPEDLNRTELLHRLSENIGSLLMTENLSEVEKLSVVNNALQILSYSKEEVEKLCQRQS